MRTYGKSVPSRVLVAQTIYLGDLILTLPLLTALRSAYPKAEIDLLVRKDLSEVAARHPAVDRALGMEKDGGHADMGELLRLVRQVRKARYDLAIILPGSIRTALVAMLADIPRRIGWDPGTTLSGPMKQVRIPSAMRALPSVRAILFFESLYRLSRSMRMLRPGFFTDTLEFQSGEHAITRNLGSIRHLGHPCQESTVVPWLQIPDPLQTEISSAYRLGREGCVALAPGAGQPTRRWPEEAFSSLARLLAIDGYTVCILGGEEDKALGERVARGAGSPGVLSVAGKLTPVGSMALIRQSKVLVANDSAPVHMASAMGTPTVALFGPTLPAFGFAPLAQGSKVLERPGLSCRPCTLYGSGSCPVGTHECLRSIAVDEVRDAVLGTAKSHRG